MTIFILRVPTTTMNVPRGNCISCACAQYNCAENTVKCTCGHAPTKHVRVVSDPIPQHVQVVYAPIPQHMKPNVTAAFVILCQVHFGVVRVFLVKERDGKWSFPGGNRGREGVLDAALRMAYAKGVRLEYGELTYRNYDVTKREGPAEFLDHELNGNHTGFYVVVLPKNNVVHFERNETTTAGGWVEWSDLVQASGNVAMVTGLNGYESRESLSELVRNATRDSCVNNPISGVNPKRLIDELLQKHPYMLMKFR